jgi:high affinity Mn2+ porin
MVFSISVQAEGADSARDAQQFNFHFQETIVDQYHPSFPAKYSGMNSLSNAAEAEMSLTSTLYLGAHLWNGGEVYFNPEISGGEGLSKTLGVAGFPNGEIYRVSTPSPQVYVARAYLQQTFGEGESAQEVADDENQLRGWRSANRTVVTIGKISVTDFFDNNKYSHDARTQFFNWSIMDNGAWDYAADTRGYTFGGVVEVFRELWAFRVAAVMVPVEANGEALDTRIAEDNGVSAEYEHSYSYNGRPGTARVFLYRNAAHAGNYRETINTPSFDMDVAQSRKYGTPKYGAGMSIEQELSAQAGVFFRAGWNDGKTETWAFTEIDRTVCVGGTLKGASWNRTDDMAGLAIVVNSVSADHEEYLSKGGYGFIIGDGDLNFGPETITEAYYSAQIIRSTSFSVDYQFVLNPAYNRDRGPVHVIAARVHTEL